MKIPLNINWQQIFLHLFNFSLLTLGLYLLLYKPVTDFMKERTEYYRQLDSDARAKQNQAGDLEASCQERLKNIEAEIDEKRLALTHETDREIEAMLQSANDRAEKIILDAREAAREERAEILEDVRQEIASMTVTAAEKLLSTSASDALDQFLDTVREE
jgi:F-type H+-transporting ATPase subunit b